MKLFEKPVFKAAMVKSLERLNGPKTTFSNVQIDFNNINSNKKRNLLEAGNVKVRFTAVSTDPNMKSILDTALINGEISR